jgi:hypothetical protein
MEERLNETGKLWETISNTLGDVCKEYLLNVLKSHNNKIEWEGERIAVSYDGNFISEDNLTSWVNSVFIGEDNTIYLETIDCPAYSIYNLSIEELYNLCKFIKICILGNE